MGVLLTLASVYYPKNKWIFERIQEETSKLLGERN